MTPLACDIAARLDRVAMSLACLGLDADIADRISAKIPGAAESLAALLVGGDAHAAAATVAGLAHLVDLDDPADAASPLGVAVALTHRYGAVGATDAARLLGVTRGRVYQLLDSGRLTRDGDGVSRESIARRLAS